jgi:hypothetical protein
VSGYQPPLGRDPGRGADPITSSGKYASAEFRGNRGDVPEPADGGLLEGVVERPDVGRDALRVVLPGPEHLGLRERSGIPPGEQVGADLDQLL